MTGAQIGIQPLVSWPRRIEPGGSYLVTVDLRRTDPTAPWPYDEEEFVVGCLLDGRPACTVRALGDAGLVLHRFGGTYGPARFVAEVASDREDFTGAALWLTLTTAGGVPFYTGRLPLDGSAAPRPEAAAEAMAYSDDRQSLSSASAGALANRADQQRYHIELLPTEATPLPRHRAQAQPSRLPVSFAAVRRELLLPALADSATFPADVQLEAERAAVQNAFVVREDATELPLVTIDPPGAMDLDQALQVRRNDRGGFTLDYAIADVGAFVRPGGALEAEALRRCQTLYLPDAKVPLYPPVLSEGAASLLPGQVRPAVLWTIDTDAYGEPVGVQLRRALVRSVARLDYDGVQADVAVGRQHPSIAALPELGRLRREHAVARGAVELELPVQQIQPDGSGGWRLVLRQRQDVVVWNAEMSLLTGICAAEMMLEAQIGVLRTLPEPDRRVVAGLRRSAQALGVEWGRDQEPAQVLSHLDPRQPRAMAVFGASTRLLRGAGYIAFDGATPEDTGHTGVGAPYAHVTAPIRRVIDRFSTEVCLAIHSRTAVPEWTKQTLPILPEAMAVSDRLAAQVERACNDQVEAWLLADRIGERFDAIVLRSSDTEPADGSASSGSGDVFITDPPVLARCFGTGLQEGSEIEVRLIEADPTTRTVRFEALTSTHHESTSGVSS
jgi:exoribonuclease R